MTGAVYTDVLRHKTLSNLFIPSCECAMSFCAELFDNYIEILIAINKKKTEVKIIIEILSVYVMVTVQAYFSFSVLLLKTSTCTVLCTD